jgi:glycine/D-amino acid oxidase-like deaminating enzyme
MRIAGTAEFAGYHPDLRPVSADGTPIIGPSLVPNLALAVGPGHLGWTFACGMARMVTGHLLGEPVDRAYRLERFAPSLLAACCAALRRSARMSRDTRAF